MMNGQKVVKVFCYEERSKQKFDELNEELFQSSKKANSYANTLMPCIMNIGNIGYVLVAVIGGILAVNQVLTIGSIAAFLQYIKAFTNPLGQVSQQINFIAMALAGAERIFDLIDEKVEEDDGYVTLVNAKEENGKIVEVEERTGLWAWKHPHSDGSITYTKLCGNVEFEDVNFGYVKDKQILYNIIGFASMGYCFIMMIACSCIFNNHEADLWKIARYIGKIINVQLIIVFVLNLAVLVIQDYINEHKYEGVMSEAYSLVTACFMSMMYACFLHTLSDIHSFNKYIMIIAVVAVIEMLAAYFISFRIKKHNWSFEK